LQGRAEHRGRAAQRRAPRGVAGVWRDARGRRLQRTRLRADRSRGNPPLDARRGGTRPPPGDRRADPATRGARLNAAPDLGMGEGMTAGERPAAPPLAVVNAAARALALPGSSTDRFAALCEHLTALLPAEAVRLHAGQRKGDRLGAGQADPASAASVAEVPWGNGRHAVLEAVGSSRPPAELRPLLETVA